MKEYRKAARSGINPIEELLKATDMELSRLKKIRDFVRDFRDKKITIKEFLQGPTGTSNMTPEQMKEIARQMFEEMFYVMEI